MTNARMTKQGAFFEREFLLFRHSFIRTFVIDSSFEFRHSSFPATIPAFAKEPSAMGEETKTTTAEEWADLCPLTDVPPPEQR